MVAALRPAASLRGPRWRRRRRCSGKRSRLVVVAVLRRRSACCGCGCGAPPVMKAGRLSTLPGSLADCGCCCGCGWCRCSCGWSRRSRCFARLVAADSAGCRAARTAARRAAGRAAARACRTAPRRRRLLPSRRRRPRNSRRCAARTAARCRSASGRGWKFGIVLAELLLRGRDQAEIMLGVLEVVLRRRPDRRRTARRARAEGIFRRHGWRCRGSSRRGRSIHRPASADYGSGGCYCCCCCCCDCCCARACACCGADVMLTVSHGLLFNNSSIARRLHSPALFPASSGMRRRHTKNPSRLAAAGMQAVLSARAPIRRRSRVVSEHPLRPRPCRGMAHLFVTRPAGL